MKTKLFTLALMLICGGVLVSCGGTPPGPPDLPPLPPTDPGTGGPGVTEIHHYHHRVYDSDPDIKSASVSGGGSSSSAEGFQAVTPPHSYSR